MKTILLFDVDGTLTKSRQVISPKMKEFLKSTSKKIELAFVGGSNLQKQKEQLENSMENFTYWFPQNGVDAYYRGENFHRKNIIEAFGEDLLQRLINSIFKYFSEVELPVKRGNFIELRSSMLNISPIGRSCSQEERDQFFQFDRENKIRENLVQLLRKEFAGEKIHFSIGGQISIDIFPTGWDKRYCLQFLKEYERIYFFGDMTREGGNDFEIFEDERTVGISVKGPEETVERVEEILSK